MARKKKPEASELGAPWLNTFADLMNLLLCFFVLLFAMSTVDAEKYEAMVNSFVDKINVFPQGGAAVGEGPFASSGTDQMVQISKFFAEFEESGNPSESSVTGEDQSEGQTGYTPEQDANEQQIIEDYKQSQLNEQKRATEEMLDELSDLLKKHKLDDLVGLKMDDDYQYVQLSIKGALLFDSGKADIKSGAVKIVDKLGDLLKDYGKNIIEILGHTDNVPIHNGLYKNNFRLSQDRAAAVFDYLTEGKGMNGKNLKVSGRGEFEPIATNKTPEGRARNRRVEINIYNAEQ